MSARRAAQIHREIAALHVELADLASDDAGDAAPVEKTSRPPRRVRVHPAPLGAPTDLDVGRARGMLRRRGIAT